MQDEVPAAPIEYVEGTGGAPAPSTDLFAILAAVLRRWKLITAITVSALIATYGVLKLVPSVYSSTAQILVFDPQGQIDATVQKPISPFVDAVSFDAMNTEINVIKSKSVALRVATELGLDRDPEFQPHGRLADLPQWLGFPGLSRADGNSTRTPGGAEEERPKSWTKPQMACLEDCRSGQTPISYSLLRHRRTRSQHSAWRQPSPTTIWRASGKCGKTRCSEWPIG